MNHRFLAGLSFRSAAELLILSSPCGSARLSTSLLERIPRTTRAQAMDVLSSQASIAGYASGA